MGEINFLNGGHWTMPMRAACDSRVVEVARPDMMRLMSQIPEMSDIIIAVFAGRRRRALDAHDGVLILIGEEESRDVRRIAEFATRNRLPFTSYAAGSDEAAHVFGGCGVQPARTAVLFGRGLIDNPSPAWLARMFGLNRDLVETDGCDVVIVGGGPAGSPRRWASVSRTTAQLPS